MREYVQSLGIEQHWSLGSTTLGKIVRHLKKTLKDLGNFLVSHLILVLDTT
jgi:hypothetical protein